MRIQGKDQGILQILQQEIAKDKSVPPSQPETNIFEFSASTSIWPTVVSLAVPMMPKPPAEFSPGGIGWGSPISLYFLYLQGFSQPVFADMVRTGPVTKFKYRRLRSLVEKLFSISLELYYLNWLILEQSGRCLSWIWSHLVLHPAFWENLSLTQALKL